MHFDRRSGWTANGIPFSGSPMQLAYKASDFVTFIKFHHFSRIKTKLTYSRFNVVFRVRFSCFRSEKIIINTLPRIGRWLTESIRSTHATRATMTRISSQSILAAPNTGVTIHWNRFGISFAKCIRLHRNPIFTRYNGASVTAETDNDK